MGARLVGNRLGEKLFHRRAAPTALGSTSWPLGMVRRSRTFIALRLAEGSGGASAGEKRYLHLALLRLGQAELMLNKACEFHHEHPTVADAARVAAHRDTGLFIGCPDVDATYEELHSKDVAVKRPHVTGHGMKQMYLRDPDGFDICFQWSANSQDGDIGFQPPWRV